MSKRAVMTVLLISLTACMPGSTPESPSTTVVPTTIAVGTSTSPAVPTTLATTTTSTRLPLENRTVVIDPGHNGMNWAHPEEINRAVDIGNGTKACNTTGTSTNDGYTESEFNWAVAQLVAQVLEQSGAVVVLTRTDNEGWGPCINERAAIGNANRADAVVSIHADGGPAESRGYHVIHPAPTPGLTDDIYDESLRLAQALRSAYAATSMPVADYVGRDGYSERDDLGGLNLSDVPAVFLEAGNMRNGIDAGLLRDPEFQLLIARAIHDALVEFLSS